jgi:hypothetical protein
MKDIGNVTGATISPANFTVSAFELNTGGCVGGASGGICFTASPSPLALTADMSWIIDFTGAGLTFASPHLKVLFSGGDVGNGHGSLLSTNITPAIPEPETYGDDARGPRSIGLRGASSPARPRERRPGLIQSQVADKTPRTTRRFFLSVCARLTPSAHLEGSLDVLRVCTSMAACLAVLATGMLSPGSVRALDATQLAVIINTLDPLSVRIGEYYAAQRRILFQNVIRVGFPPGKTTLTSQEFGALKAWADEQTLAGVQAFALTWVAPYRVECMSITSAFAFGYDPAFCAEGCKPTRPSPYFNSPIRLPFTQLGIRPTMAIAATSFERAKELIDRGVESDGMFPAGTAYLLSTSDRDRNVR